MCGISSMIVSGAGHALSCFGNVAYGLTLGSFHDLNGRMKDRPRIHLTKIVIKTVLVAAIVGLIAYYASIPVIIPITLTMLSTFRYLIKQEVDNDTWFSETQSQKSLVTGDRWYNKILSKCFENPYDSNVSGGAFPEF